MATPLLQPPLARLFTPRPSLLYLKQIDRAPNEKQGPSISPIGSLAKLLETSEPPVERVESAAEKKKRRIAEKIAENQRKLEEQTENWDPSKDEKIQSDPFKTIIVSRLSYETNEKRLEKEFEKYGSVKSVRIITNIKDGKSRGYAFVEYSKEKEAMAAYRDADGIKIDQRRVVVDIVRSQTVKGWKPRRLGGGLGSTRMGSKNQNQKFSGRDPRANDAYKEDERKPIKYEEDRDRDYRRDDRRGSWRDRKRSRSRSPERDRHDNYDRRRINRY